MTGAKSPPSMRGTPGHATGPQARKPHIADGCLVGEGDRKRVKQRLTEHGPEEMLPRFKYPDTADNVRAWQRRSEGDQNRSGKSVRPVALAHVLELHPAVAIQHVRNLIAGGRRQLLIAGKHGQALEVPQTEIAHGPNRETSFGQRPMACETLARPSERAFVGLSVEGYPGVIQDAETSIRAGGRRPRQDVPDSDQQIGAP